MLIYKYWWREISKHFLCASWHRSKFLLYILYSEHENIKNNTMPSILIKSKPNLFTDTNDPFVLKKKEVDKQNRAYFKFHWG